MALKHWPDIALFSTNRAFYLDPEHSGWRMGAVTYRAKVKLHGSCAAIQRLPDGSLEAQSRDAVLTAESDMHGFAKWALSQAWDGLPIGTVLYGEWCGPKVQNGTAVGRIPERIFAVFGARLASDDRNVPPIANPEQLAELAAGSKGAYVLPWHGDPIVFDWHDTDEALAKVVDAINPIVEAIEACDPWVKAVFGIEGVGEGLVYYPVLGSVYAPLFKAKGEKHRVTKAAKAVQIAPEVVASIAEFVEMAVPLPRLEQGVSVTGAPSMKSIGAFLKWVVSDVQKETQAELAASGLTFEQVSKAVMERARNWYIAEVKK